MKNFFNALLTITFMAIMIGIGIFVFAVLLTQGLLYTFHINLNFYGVCALTMAAILGLDYLINMFKS